MAVQKRKKEQVKIPAVIYARYSSSGQREESIEGQIRECTDWAKRNGFDIVSTYTDKALTGRTDKRPGFQQMIADSEKHAFQAVICWKTDRFARNRYDAATYKYKLRKNGIRLYYAKEAVPEGPEGIILESVMEGFAEYYSANLAENVKRGNYDSALQYKTLGKKVLGYRKSVNDQFEIDPVTAPAVRRIFSEYDSGRTMKEIVEGLNADGFRTAVGGEFNKSSLRRILRNQKYIGIYAYKDIYAEDAIPPLVERDMFERCQKKLMAKRHAPKPRADVRFLLTSKIFCGLCSSPMTGDSGTGEHGQKYYYYTCNSRRAHKCSKKRVKKDDIEKLVIDRLIRIIMDDEFIDDLAERCIESIKSSDGNDSALNALKMRQKENQKKIDNLIRAIEAGIFSASTADALNKLETERDQLQIAVQQERLRMPDLDKNMILFALDKLRVGDVEDEIFRQRLVETFLNAVYLYDDGKCIIHLNFSKNNNTVTAEYNKSCLHQFEKRAASSAYRDIHELMIVQGTVISMWMSFSI